jgi:tetratricopeptide (TPR) repeat protein
MTMPATTLDADELLHLAIAASDRDQTDQALGFLKRAIEVDPNNAKAHYLLGAEHAQIGLFERAIDDMRRAVELDATLDAARFQLGLLLITSSQPQAADEVWHGLEPLGPDHFYVLFKTGLMHLARDEFADCLRCLRAGIAANQTLAPLNTDMQQIIDQVQGMLPPGGGETQDDEAATHLLLNAYAGRQR